MRSLHVIEIEVQDESDGDADNHAKVVGLNLRGEVELRLNQQDYGEPGRRHCNATLKSSMPLYPASAPNTSPLAEPIFQAMCDANRSRAAFVPGEDEVQ